MTLPVILITLPKILLPYTLPLALTVTPYRFEFTLPAVTLPDAVMLPATLTPVGVNTATLATALTVTAMLPLLAAAMFEVPAVTGKPVLVAVTPVSPLPLPKK